MPWELVRYIPKGLRGRSPSWLYTENAVRLITAIQSLGMAQCFWMNQLVDGNDGWNMAFFTYKRLSH